MIQEALGALGLSEAEQQAYVALLELGEASVGQLAFKAKLKRPTTYLIVEALKMKGLVSMTKRGKKTLLIAEDPRKILDMLEERRRKVERVMPELLSLANNIDRKPTIRYFEGMDGIKDVYYDTLNYSDQEMLSFYSDTYATHFEERFFEDFYFAERKKKKIWVRAILPDQEIIQKLIVNDVAHLRKTKIVPKGSYGINIEINMYGKRKIGIISFEEQFALIIESEKIYTSLKNIFELLWGFLPERKG
jgi:sugar-specific transcriptional regulator TrmB